MCDTILFHSPSQIHVVAYFLSGLPGKNIQRATFIHSTITNILHECVTILFHSPSQIRVVAYFLSGLPGKNIQRAMSTHTLYHPKHNPSATHHLTPFNTLSYIPAYTYTLLCDTIPSLFSLKNTCGSAYFLPCRQGNPGPAGKPIQDNSTTHLLQSLSEKGCVTVTRSLSFPMNTCGVAYVTRAS